MDSRGVVLGVIDPARNEVPKTVLIEQERQALLAKSRQLELTMTRLTSLQGDLEKRRSKFDEAQQANTALQQELQANLQARTAAEEGLKQAKARIEELEDAERFRLKTSSQGLIVPKKK
jgi:septal ring factor EnvC (AmiA/AmiB activator)